MYYAISGKEYFSQLSNLYLFLWKKNNTWSVLANDTWKSLCNFFFYSHQHWYWNYQWNSILRATWNNKLQTTLSTRNSIILTFVICVIFWSPSKGSLLNDEVKLMTWILLTFIWNVHIILFHSDFDNLTIRLEEPVLAWIWHPWGYDSAIFCS